MGQILKEVVRSDQLKIPSDDKYYMCAYTSCHAISKQAGFAFDKEAFYGTHAVTAYKQARGSSLCFPSIYDRFHTPLLSTPIKVDAYHYIAHH